MKDATAWSLFCSHTSTAKSVGINRTRCFKTEIWLFFVWGTNKCITSKYIAALTLFSEGGKMSSTILSMSSPLCLVKVSIWPFDLWCWEGKVLLRTPRWTASLQAQSFFTAPSRWQSTQRTDLVPLVFTTTSFPQKCLQWVFPMIQTPLSSLLHIKTRHPSKSKAVGSNVHPSPSFPLHSSFLHISSLCMRVCPHVINHNR